ncbi:MAG: DUF3106 domain-containing protein [Limisphaerales bacterium]
MNHSRQGRRWLVLAPVVALFIFPASGQNIANLPMALAPGRTANAPPPLPSTPSPVDYFRKLLAMPPQQLQSFLAHKSPKVRERILAKVKEYAALDPDERELRLRATDLRWYLLPILRAPDDQRAVQLAAVPTDLRGLVQSRLMQWEILPPALQQEFLDNEHIAGYFAGLSSSHDTPVAPVPSKAEQSHWNAYSEGERQAMISQFNAFFDLSPMEKQKALGRLTDAERKQIEATLQTFGKLSPRQRAQCIHAFGRFASMSPGERAEFLKNARRWSRMTPSQRQAWRDLVAHVPQWPPLPTAAIMPPAIMPPTPRTQRDFHAVAVTNHG